MGKFIIVGAALLSGVGTVPCLLYLVWLTLQENKAEEQKRRDYEIENR